MCSGFPTPESSEVKQGSLNELAVAVGVQWLQNHLPFTQRRCSWCSGTAFKQAQVKCLGKPPGYLWQIWSYVELLSF